MSEAGRDLLLRSERIRMLYGAPYYGYVVAGGILLGVAQGGWLLWPHVRREHLLVWIGVNACTELARAVLHAAYHRARPAHRHAWRWGAAKVVHEFCAALAWGSIMFLYNPAVPETLTIAVIAVVMMGAVGSTGHFFHPPSLFALLAGTSLPAFAVLLPADGAQERILAIVVGITTVGIAVGSLLAIDVMRRSILVRFDLADAVERERRLRDEALQMRHKADLAQAQLNQFFSAASHDLRQPVHALGLYMSLLRKRPTEREREELIENVTYCAESLDRLFTSILGVAEAVRTPAAPASVACPLNDVIRQVAAQFAPEAMRKSLALRSVATSLCTEADTTILARILGNLVSNAIRYTERGSVLIGVRRRGTSRCELVVADTGIGIAPENQQKIFEDFYQVDNPGRDRGRGYGLGLAIVRRLCENRGYEIRVRSTPGRGSLFSVSLPTVHPSAATAPATEAEIAADAQNLHVLFVEDDAIVRDAMQRMLRSWNMAVHACGTGDQALAILRSMTDKRWHVLLDYRLAEGENGLDIAQRIRATFDPAPRITMMTGDTDPDMHKAAAEQGVIVLSKPVRPIRLRAALTAMGTTRA